MKKLILVTAVLALINTAASAADADAVKSIPAGSQRGDVYSVIGLPDSKETEYREIYMLANGDTAVLRYADDTLVSGFILVN